MVDLIWLASLNIGDKVAIRVWAPIAGYKHTIHIVEKITKTRQIKVSGIDTRFRDGQIPSDLYTSGKELCPLTPEIEDIVFRRETLEMIRNVKNDISNEKLRKIKVILQEDGT